MTRKPRGLTAGGLFHLFARGNNHQAIFLTRDDRGIYLQMLAQVIRRYGWRVLAWCLMDNHVHLVVETPEESLSAGMHRLHGNYAAGFNRRHGRKNHLFGDRFGNVPILDEAQLLTELRYVVHNPVKAGLARSPEAYEWSSHRHVRFDTAPHLLDVPRLLEMFESLGGDPLARYLALIRGGAPQESVAS